MRPDRSTLLTSPVSQADFFVRLAFFTIAPPAIVRVAACFPVTGTLAGVALVVFVCLAGEAVHGRVARWPWLRKLLERELELAAYYRLRGPRPFLYYVFFPLLAPYWLVVRDARREFWLYKGWTAGGLAMLLATSAVQYLTLWRPELGPREYLPVFGITLAVDAVLALSLLMPIVTTVVHFHQSFRRGRLVALLVVALGSTAISSARLVRRRDPVVSYATRERVALRAAAAPARAREAQFAALRAAWKEVRVDKDALEADGKIEGDALEAARAALARLYKTDETFAFDLWGFPRGNPRTLVLYVASRGKRPPVWLAMNRAGQPVPTLPDDAFVAMRRAAVN